MAPLHPDDRQPILRLVPRPADTNDAGEIFGGWIMSQVDIAGSIPARERARGRVATVAAKDFHFQKPVRLGDLVSLYAEVLNCGHTSISVGVEAWVTRLHNGDVAHLRVAVARMIYVALDADGRPRPLPAGAHRADD